MITHAHIIRTVAKYAGITSPELLGRDKRRTIANYRKIAMYLCRKYTDASWVTIGGWFHRDHTTVIYCVRGVENSTDPVLLEHLAAITDLIESIRIDKQAQMVSVGNGMVFA